MATVWVTSTARATTRVPITPRDSTPMPTSVQPVAGGGNPQLLENVGRLLQPLGPQLLDAMVEHHRTQGGPQGQCRVMGQLLFHCHQGRRRRHVGASTSGVVSQPSASPPGEATVASGRGDERRKGAYPGVNHSTDNGGRVSTAEASCPSQPRGSVWMWPLLPRPEPP